MDTNNIKKVDIIIPAYKPGKDMKKLMTALLGQSYAVNRIIIINTDRHYWDSDIDAMSDKIFVKHIKKSQFDHGGTRNMAIGLSDADIAVCMTQDAVPFDEYVVENLVKCFGNKNIWAAYARQLPKQDCSEIEKYTRKFNYPDKSYIKTKNDIKKYGIKTYFCSNVCAAYRVDKYKELGGFIKHTIFSEDMIYAHNIINEGGAVYYCADAKVIHSHNYTCKQQFNRNFDLAVAQKEHPEVFSGLKSESEGIRLVLNTAKYLIKIGKPLEVIYLFFYSAAKYMGYKLGFMYERIPKKIMLKLTSNPQYFERR